MAEQIENAPLCACGCGLPVTPITSKPGHWYTYRHAHALRKPGPGTPNPPHLKTMRLSYPDRTCDRCKTVFTPWNKKQRFCTHVCQTRFLQHERYLRLHHGKPPDTERSCGICGKNFPRRDKNDWRRKYCSPECSKEAHRRTRHTFHERNPEYRRRMEFIYNGGWPTTVTRFFKRCPDALRQCQVCGEARVIDIHHKAARNGVPVRASNSQQQDVWVLCPTHHAMLTRGVTTASELGLA